MAKTPRKERISRYPFEIVYQHVRKEHPACPDFAVEYIANEVASREWKGAKLGMTVGIVMQSTLRHLMTEYETLLLHGVERGIARRQVQPKIQAMLAAWKQRPLEVNEK
jgi:hypothetical protein